jgi:hypothetical protein
LIPFLEDAEHGTTKVIKKETNLVGCLWFSVCDNKYWDWDGKWMFGYLFKTAFNIIK